MIDRFHLLLLLAWLLTICFLVDLTIPSSMVPAAFGFVVASLICLVVGLRTYGYRGLWVFLPLLIQIALVMHWIWTFRCPPEGCAPL